MCFVYPCGQKARSHSTFRCGLITGDPETNTTCTVDEIDVWIWLVYSEQYFILRIKAESGLYHLLESLKDLLSTKRDIKHLKKLNLTSFSCLIFKGIKILYSFNMRSHLEIGDIFVFDRRSQDELNWCRVCGDTVFLWSGFSRALCERTHVFRASFSGSGGQLE